MVEFVSKPFSKLSVDELYAILRLRSEIFVVEQNCVYQDVDTKDQKALHIIGSENGNIVAYARIFEKQIYFDEASIGRVVVAKEYRKLKLGHELMDYAICSLIEKFGPQKIKISAQAHLEKFYNSHGFIAVGETYLEDDIPHTAMFRD
jgi:ElaA protein